MLASDHRYVIINGERVVIEVRDRVRSAPDREFAGGQVQAVGNALKDVDADGICVDVVRGVSAVVDAPQYGRMG